MGQKCGDAWCRKERGLTSARRRFGGVRVFPSDTRVPLRPASGRREWERKRAVSPLPVSCGAGGASHAQPSAYERARRRPSPR
ncbi:unnamed protein product, partial [Iphiclides podalirius]